MLNFFKKTKSKINLTVALIVYSIASSFLLASLNCPSRCDEVSSFDILLGKLLLVISPPAMFLGIPLKYTFILITKFDNILIQTPILVVGILIQIFIFYVVACIIMQIFHSFKKRKH